MAPVRGHEVQNAAGDECKGNGVGTCHPLAMHGDLPVARGDESGGGADDPSGGLHGGSREARTAPGESDTGEGADKDRDHVEATQNAMELKVTLAKPSGELEGAREKGNDAAKRVRDEEIAVGDNLQTVSVVHRIVGYEENF